MLIEARMDQNAITIGRHWRTLQHLIAACWMMSSALPAQLPASGKLSGPDEPLFRAEVARIRKALSSAPDKSTVTYEMARTFAAGKQWPEAMVWLRSVTDLKAGFDPSRDKIFAELRGTKEFDAIVAAARAARPSL